MLMVRPPPRGPQAFVAGSHRENAIADVPKDVPHIPACHQPLLVFLGTRDSVGGHETRVSPTVRGHARRSGHRRRDLTLTVMHGIGDKGFPAARASKEDAPISSELPLPPD